MAEHILSWGNITPIKVIGGCLISMMFLKFVSGLHSESSTCLDLRVTTKGLEGTGSQQRPARRDGNERINVIKLHDCGCRN